MDLKFIQDLEYFFKTELKLKQATVYRSIQRVKKIIQFSISENYLKKDPFHLYKNKKHKSTIVYLTEVELKSLMQYKFSQNRLEQIRDMFVFSCYSGLRFSDCERVEIQWKNGDRIEFTQFKSSDNAIVKVPIWKLFNGKAGAIFDKYSEGKERRIFNKVGYSTAAAVIKELTALTTIIKHITFHSSRHSFAVECLNRGITIGTLSKLLGHASIITTINNYAEITNKKIDDEIDRVDWG